MKVAIVGGNFLGCSTAYYLRKTLDELRKNEADDSQRSIDDIVIFEKTSQLGGQKFCTHRIDGLDVVTGTASGVDMSYCPLFKSLLDDAGIESPSRSRGVDWAYFNWDKDEYEVACVPSRTLRSLACSNSFRLLFHIIMVASTAYFFNLYKQGVLTRVFANYDNVWGTLIYIWLSITMISGFGIVPFQTIVSVWVYFSTTVMVNLSAKFKYGASIDTAGECAAQMNEHLRVVSENNSCSSGISVGHLLSRCGLAKYVRSSASEQFEKFHVSENFRNTLLAPVMAYAYIESRYRPGTVANAFATLLEIMSRCPVPTSIRARKTELTVNQTKTICPKLLSVARAHLKVCSEVLGIFKTENNNYSLKLRTKNSEFVKHDEFDAVILAANVDAEKFEAGEVAPEVEFNLGKTNTGIQAIEAEAVQSTMRRKNTAKIMSLVVGDLNPDYFLKNNIEDVAKHSFILNSMDYSEVKKVGKRTWRVVSADEIDLDENETVKEGLASKLFKKVEKVVVANRQQRRYVATPLRNLNGTEAPAIILGRKIINAAATDRVANHVEMDCLAARNAASLLNPGLIAWKQLI